MFKKLAAGLAVAGSLACSTCVAQGARIRTPRGPRPIEELREGDEVTCVDPTTGRLETGRITAIRSALRECVRLEIGATSLMLTSDHPAYCPDSGQWAPAGDWVLGKRARLLRAVAEQVSAVAVTATDTFAGVHPVFDLTVDNPLHNFVANDVLVHNKSPLQRQCTVPDGGPVTFEFDSCTCPAGGEGYLVCPSADGGIECADCPAPGDAGADAGALDAGPLDGGASDGG